MNAADTRRPGWDARTVEPLVHVGKARRQRDYRATHPS